MINIKTNISHENYFFYVIPNFYKKILENINLSIHQMPFGIISGACLNFMF